MLEKCYYSQIQAAIVTLFHGYRENYLYTNRTSMNKLFFMVKQLETILMMGHKIITKPIFKTQIFALRA